MYSSEEEDVCVFFAQINRRRLSHHTGRPFRVQFDMYMLQKSEHQFQRIWSSSV